MFRIIKLNTAIIYPGLSGKKSIENALKFIEKKHTTGERIIVYGYSRGGGVAVELAKKLNDKSIEVDLLVTVDAAFGPFSGFNGFIDRRIPKNVVENINFYQINSSGSSLMTETGRRTSKSDSSNKGGSSHTNSGTSNFPGSRGYANVGSSLNTKVSNYEFSGKEITHGKMEKKVKHNVIIFIKNRLKKVYKAKLLPIPLPTTMPAHCTGRRCHHSLIPKKMVSSIRGDFLYGTRNPLFKKKNSSSEHIVNWLQHAR